LHQLHVDLGGPRAVLLSRKRELRLELRRGGEAESYRFLGDVASQHDLVTDAGV
jgi:hypothetical protein